MRLTKREFAKTLLIGGASLYSCNTFAQRQLSGNLYIRRYAPALASDGHRIFLSGGAPIGAAPNEEHFYSSLLGTVEEIDPATLRQRFLATAIFPRANHASVWAEDRLWLLGGRTRVGTQGRLVSETERINVDSQAIWRGPDLPVALISLSATMFANSIFVFGGDFREPGDRRLITSARVFECAPPHAEWRERSPMPLALGNSAAVTLGERIYLIGGFDRERAYAVTQIFDPRADSWSLGPPPPIPLSAHGAAAMGDRIFVFGDYQNQSTVLGFDPASGEWRSIAVPFTPRRHVRCVSTANAIIVAGGNQSSAAPATDTVEVFSSELLRETFDAAVHRA